MYMQGLYQPRFNEQENQLLEQITMHEVVTVK